MKKKRFYNNKRRNEKWTEKPEGRKIYFADKYTDDSDGGNKYSGRQQKTKKPFFTKDRFEKLLKGTIVTVGGIVIIGIGYTIMDIHLERNAMPYDETGITDTAVLNNMDLTVKGSECQPLSLDGGIMLSAVIDTALENGYSSLAFDIKRNDGTVGYNSRLATVSAFGAISSPSSDLAASVKLLSDNDILPVGRISCYKDNIVPNSDAASSLLENGNIYKDSAGNTYLNPLADSTYNYIRGIIDEAAELGVSVFVLDNYDLPEGLNDKYAGGFNRLASKLSSDLGENIKLYKAVNLSLNSDSAKNIEEEWKEKTEQLDTNQDNIMFCISAKNTDMVKQFLDNQGITNYIISE